jgi:hypothetical protein
MEASPTMRSYPKCIPPFLLTPPSTPALQRWNELAAFRETALRHFTRPEDRAALEHLGSFLLESALEQAHLWPPYEGSETTNLVAALCRDLDHSQHYLVSVADARHQAALSAPEHALATAAAHNAQLLQTVIGQLQQAHHECLVLIAGGVN